jgi:MFS family permease
MRSIDSPPRCPSGVLRPDAVPGWAVLAVCCWINACVYVDRTTISGALPYIRTQFLTSKLQEGLLGSGFMLSYAAAVLPMSHAALRWPAVCVLLTGLFCWIIGCVGTTMVAMMMDGSTQQTRYGVLLAFRVLIGAAEACCQAIMPAWVHASAPRHRAGMWVGLLLASMNAGMGVGTMLPGILGPRLWPVATLGAAISVVPCTFILICWTRRPIVVHDSASALYAGNVWEVCTGLLRCREWWVVTLGYSCFVLSMTSISFWIVSYAVVRFPEQTFEHDTVVIGSVMFGCGIIGTIVGGWLTQDSSRGSVLKNWRRVCCGSLVCGLAAVLAFLPTRVPFGIFAALLSCSVLFGVSVQPGVTQLLLTVVPSANHKSISVSASILLIHILGDVPGIELSSLWLQYRPHDPVMLALAGWGLLAPALWWLGIVLYKNRMDTRLGRALLGDTRF